MSLISSISRPCRRTYMIWARKPDRHLRYATGVIHVGANTGQERDLYELFDLEVLWVEPIDEVFQALERNISDYQGQRAIKALVTDEDHKEYQFHIASNAGQSSSIYELKEHRDVWPDVTTEKTVTLQSRRLDTLIDEQRIDARRYDALVMDTQGSELLVLKGAGRLLEGIRLIKTEAADFDAYEGACSLDDLKSFLEPEGFVETNRTQIARHADGGGYYDVMFRRQE